VIDVELIYDRLNIDDLGGATQADYLVALDAHLCLLEGDVTVYDEPGFPVVELARSLLIWLGWRDHHDFEFNSMSYEEVGSITIRQVAAGWEFGSVFDSSAATAPVDWAEVDRCCRDFIARVEADLLALGLDPAEVIKR
jgi:hypothetical protein